MNQQENEIVEYAKAQMKLHANNAADNDAENNLIIFLIT